MEAFIVSFPSATAAMQFASLAESRKIAGRIIPVPRALAAGCGMAWLSAIEEKTKILELLEREKVSFSKATEWDYKTRWKYEKRFGAGGRESNG